MKKLTVEQYKEYITNPLGNDSKVRKWAGVPDNRYYSVITYPEKSQGMVYVNTKDFRKVSVNKISKSDQE